MDKYFSPSQATGSLILVRPIVGDILEKVKKASALNQEVKLAKDAKSMPEKQMLEKLKEAEDLLAQVEYHLKELESIGAILRDFKEGIVDFPCIANSQIVHLCWMYGEKEVAHWHYSNEPFTQRKSVDILLNQTVA